jgi:hypothetical protein
MALKPCKECNREVSTEARTCPHCGKNDPTGRRASPLAMGCLLLILLGVLGTLISSSSKDRPVASSGISSTSDPAVAAVLSPPTPVGSQWTYSHDADEMTGKASHIASVRSNNTVEFEFPYSGVQHGRLSIRRHPRWGNDVFFAIEKGQLLCTSYEGCTVLVRFDEGEPLSFSAAPAADHSTETVFIQNYDRFVTKMRAAKEVRISPKVYQQGDVVFTFDVSGFDQKAFRGQ